MGKVWEFCRGGTAGFRGFQAGGGKAYEFNGQPIPTLAPGPGTPSYDAASPDDVSISPPGAYPVDQTRYANKGCLGETQEPTIVPNYFEERLSPSPSPVKTPNPFRMKEPSPDTTVDDRPTAKRRQTGHLNEADELRKNWVMVDDEEPSPAPARTTFSAKKAPSTASRIPAASRSSVTSRMQNSPRFSTPNAARRISAPSPRFSERSNIPTRASSRVSMASPASFAGASPSLNPREPASYASPRSPTRTSTPNPFATAGSRIPTPKVLGTHAFARTESPVQSRTSAIASPSHGVSLHPSPVTSNFTSRIAMPSTPGHRKSLSTASVGSARGGRSSLGYDDVEKVQTSPRLDEEGRQLATKRLATEKRNYSRLDKLNMELQGLIRQGQEALGTNYDVDMDEAWEEDA